MRLAWLPLEAPARFRASLVGLVTSAALAAASIANAGPLAAGDLVAIGDSFGSPALYRIDLANGTATPLVVLPSAGYRDLAAEPSGTVLVSSSAGIQRVDPMTGSITSLSPLNAFVDVAANGRIFVGNASGVGELDPTNGVVTPIYSSSEVFGFSASALGRIIATREVPVNDPLRPDVLRDREVLSIDISSGVVSVLDRSVAHSRSLAFPFDEFYFSRTLDTGASPDGTPFVWITYTSTVGDGGGVASPTDPDAPSVRYGEIGSFDGFVADDSGRLVVSSVERHFGASTDIQRITRVGNADVTEDFDLLAGTDGFSSLDVVPVPEPGTALLVAAGLLALSRRSTARG